MPKPNEYQLVIERGQPLEIWGHEEADDRLRVAFDSGENGFLVLTREHAEELMNVLVRLLHG